MARSEKIGYVPRCDEIAHENSNSTNPAQVTLVSNPEIQFYDAEDDGVKLHETEIFLPETRSSLEVVFFPKTKVETETATFVVKSADPYQLFICHASSMGKSVEIFRSKIQQTKNILVEPVKIYGNPEELDDEILTIVNAWKFIVENTTGLIGKDPLPFSLTSPPISRESQVFTILLRAKQRFSQLLKSGQALNKSMNLITKEIKSLRKRILNRFLGDVRNSPQSPMQLTEEMQNVQKENLDFEDGSKLMVIRWSCEGICLQHKFDWLKLRSCITHHKIYFLDLFAVKLGQFAEDAEMQLKIGQDLLQKPRAGDGDSSDVNANEIENLGVLELFPKISRVLEDKDDEYHEFLPKEKDLIFQKIVELEARIGRAATELTALLTIITELKTAMSEFYKKRKMHLRSTAPPSHLELTKELTFSLELWISDSKSDFEDLFASNVLTHGSGVYESYAQLPRTNSPSHASFFTVTPSHILDVKSSSSVMLSVEQKSLYDLSRKRKDETVDVGAEVLEAHRLFRQTGNLAEVPPQLIRNDVKRFLKEADRLGKFHKDNIKAMTSALDFLFQGGHENQAGLLFWSSVTLKVFFITKLDKDQRWKSKVMDLIQEFIQESNELFKLFPKYLCTLEQREVEFNSLVEKFCRVDEYIRDCMKDEVFSKMTSDATPEVHIAETIKSGLCRVSLTATDYTIFSIPSGPGDTRKIVKFTASPSLTEFEMLKLTIHEVRTRLFDFRRMMVTILNIEKHAPPIHSLMIPRRKLKYFHTLEKATIVYSLSNMQTQFRDMRILIETVDQVLFDFKTSYLALDSLGLSKFGPRLSDPITNQDAQVLSATIEEAKQFTFVNYIPEIGGMTELRLKNFIEVHGRGSKETTSRYRKLIGNFTKELNFPHDPELEPPSLEICESRDWLLPLGEVKEYFPEPPIILKKYQVVPGSGETSVDLPFEIVRDKYEDLSKLAVGLKKKLHDPIFAVFNLLLSPPPSNLDLTIGYFHAVCFLINIGCVQLNTMGRRTQGTNCEDAEKLQVDCTGLTNIFRKISSQHKTASDLVVETSPICRLLWDMENLTKNALQMIHLKYTQKMIDCLNERIRIMEPKEIREYVFSNSQFVGKDQAQKRGQIKLHWDGSSEVFKVETLDGNTLDFSEMALQNQLDFLQEMSNVISEILKSILAHYSQAKVTQKEVLTILENIRAYITDYRKEFRPEEIHVLLSSIRELILISREALQFVEKTMENSKVDIVRGYFLAIANLKRSPDQTPSTVNIQRCVHDQAFSLTLDSCWAPKKIPLLDDTYKIQPRHLGNVVKVTTPVGSIQRIVGFQKDAKDIAELTLANYNLILAMFEGLNDPEENGEDFTGLSPLAVLIGFAFLELKNFHGFTTEGKENVHLSFNTAKAKAKEFNNKCVKSLKQYVASTENVIQKMVNFLEWRRTINKLQNNGNPLSMTSSGALLCREYVSKSTLMSVLDMVRPAQKFRENWMLILGDFGSKLILREMKGKGLEQFASLGKHNQAHVTARLLDVFVQIFERVSENVEKSLRDETQRFNYEINILRTKIKMFTRSNRLLADERVGVREALETMVASIQDAKNIVARIEELSTEICIRLKAIKLYKKLNSIPPENLPVKSRNAIRKVGLHIQGFHTSPVSIGLPVNLL